MDELKKLMIDFITKYAFSNKDFFLKKQSDSATQIIKFEPKQIKEKVNANLYGLCMELNYVFFDILKKKGHVCRLIKCLKPHHDSYYQIFHLAIISSGLYKAK